MTTLAGTKEEVYVFTHVWWSKRGPTDDPIASDPAALRRHRKRILRIADTIVLRHGAPFPAPYAPR